MVMMRASADHLFDLLLAGGASKSASDDAAAAH
jgi:hypothetical protein